MLHYGVDSSFVEVLKAKLRNKLVLISLLWLVIGAAMYFFLVRLVKPLQAITRASESMAHGDLNADMPKGLPQDELGKLATIFSVWQQPCANASRRSRTMPTRFMRSRRS